MDLLTSLTEHWAWLSPPLAVLAAVMGWLGRRKGFHPWEAFVRQLRLNRDLADCQQDLAGAIQSRDYLKIALREITEAAAMVKTAHDTGYLTMTEPSPTAPSSSPASSTNSPSPPGGTPETRSR